MRGARGRALVLVAVLLGIASCSARPPEALSAPVDRVVVAKGERRLRLLPDSTVVREYAIALGRDPIGHKQREGDDRTPEGLYSIVGRNPRSTYHRSLRISYPSEQDRARAAERGLDPGGDIMIHGIRNGLGWLGSLHRSVDWTRGCIVVTNAEIEEIWALVADGTPVEIRP